MQETQETWFHSLGWEDPLQEEMATHSGILAWKNPMDRGACPQWATVRGVINAKEFSVTFSENSTGNLEFYLEF